jgi:hypothetical protein
LPELSDDQKSWQTPQDEMRMGGRDTRYLLNLDTEKGAESLCWHIKNEKMEAVTVITGVTPASEKLSSHHRPQEDRKMPCRIAVPTGGLEWPICVWVDDERCDSGQACRCDAR